MEFTCDQCGGEARQCWVHAAWCPITYWNNWTCGVIGGISTCKDTHRCKWGTGWWVTGNSASTSNCRNTDQWKKRRVTRNNSTCISTWTDVDKWWGVTGDSGTSTCTHTAQYKWWRVAQNSTKWTKWWIGSTARQSTVTAARSQKEQICRWHLLEATLQHFKDLRFHRLKPLPLKERKWVRVNTWMWNLGFAIRNYVKPNKKGVIKASTNVISMFKTEKGRHLDLIC